MNCPFLREGRARYCNAAPVRKLIMDGPGAAAEGRCSSAAYTECALVRQDEAGHARCPHLEQIHVQYCAATSVAPVVPFSESLSRCTGAGHRFCETYLALARPRNSWDTPPDLLFAPNHMWLAVSEEGLCHIGLDAFAAHVAHPVDRVTFINPSGTRRPAVSLQVNGVEWPISFPNPLLIKCVNTKLQKDARRLSEDPYGCGWLFEGWEVPQRTRAGLIAGAQGAAWMEEEKLRLSRFVNDGQQLYADGGEAARGVVRLLPHASAIALYQQFFSRTEWSVEE